MYEKFFGLNENPFSISPDPRYLYMTESHRDALAHLLYGIEREGGIMVLTGEVGTGKTTLCRYFLQRLPKHVEIAFILHPRLTAHELLGAICDEFRVDVDPHAPTKRLVDAIHQHLLARHAAGVHLALLIDEAQNLSADVLEQLRLLTNLETDQKKLLQIILLGQPELRELLALDRLRQLAQRVTARFHLRALDRGEVSAYIACRLRVAGCERELFTPPALRQIARLSKGIPRLINLVADRALLGAYTRGEASISAAVVRQAWQEIGLKQRGGRGWRPARQTLFAAFGGLSAGLVALGLAAVLLQPVAPEDRPRLAEGAMDATTATAPGTPELAQSALAPTQETSLAQVGENSAVAVLDAATGGSNNGSAQTPDPVSPPLSVLATYQPGEKNERQAYDALLESWGGKGRGQNRAGACRTAETYGLRCHALEGNWRRVIQLDRPVILRLLNRDGLPFHATLLALAVDGAAYLSLDGVVVETSLAEIDPHWQGQYALLYKLPPWQSPIIRPGDEQDRNIWLRQQLDEVAVRWAGDPDAPASVLPDATAGLEERIRWFQRSTRLEQDGVAGVMTLITLNNWLREDVPRLTPAGKAVMPAVNASEPAAAKDTRPDRSSPLEETPAVSPTVSIRTEPAGAG